MKKILVGVFGCVAAGLPALAGASLYTLSNLFVFGDSLSDGGNSGLLTYAATGGAIAFPPPPYYQGPSGSNQSHYSNGPVAVEYLWNRYRPGDTSFQPSLANGTNYAIGGATTGTESFNEINPNLILPTDPPTDLRPIFEKVGSAWQLQEFTADLPALSFDPATSLFAVWLFPNDLFYYDGTDPHALPGQVPGSAGGADVISNGIANIVAIIQTLVAAGAEHVLVPNMPDLSDTPAFLGDPDMQDVSEAFNFYLALAMTALDTALTDVEIVQFDTSAALQTLISNPVAYGLTNTTQSCIANPLSCNPDSWLFWDDVHPTTRVHAILGSMMYQAVPEPNGLLLVVAGVLGVLAWRRRAPPT